jgi:hypothetical protein
MHPRSKKQGKSQAIGMRELLGECKSFVDSLKGLVWIAQMPEGEGPIHPAQHSGVLPVEEDVRAVLLGIIEGNALFKVCAG